MKEVHNDMIQSDKYKKIWVKREKEHWGERFNSEEVRAGFIEVFIFGRALEYECISKLG